MNKKELELLVKERFVFEKDNQMPAVTYVVWGEENGKEFKNTRSIAQPDHIIEFCEKNFKIIDENYRGFSPSGGRNAIKFGFINQNLSHLLGQILTVIDATMEGEKRDATKSLIRDYFSKKQDWFSELAWKEETGNQGDVRDEWEDALVPFLEEETIGISFK